MASQRARRRLLAGVVIITALVLVSEGGAAQGANAAGTDARAEFRPIARATDQGPLPMRRQRSAAGRAEFPVDRRGWLPEITDGRSGARKAVPVQRGQELGLRFRPDDRDTLYGQYPPAGLVGGEVDPTRQPFRPIEPRRRPTYEELEAQRQTGPASPPASIGYPVLQPPMLPPAAGPWPRW